MKRRTDLPLFLLLRSLMATVRVLPRPAALAAGAAFGRAAHAAGLRRAVTTANIAAAFPDLDEPARAAIVRGVYQHFGRMAADSLRLSAEGPQGLGKFVDDGDLVRLLDPALEQGKGAIILTGHIGNWELAGAHLAARGYPIVAVVKPPSNAHVARHTERVRQKLGITSVAMHEARLEIPAALRQNRVIALVADQGALRSNTWSTFFGRPTKTPVGPGLFHHQTGAPVYFGAMVAQPGGRYRLMGELLTEKEEGSLEDVVQRLADRYRGQLEALVRQFPEQYLWTHRLWKQPPPAAPAAP